MTKPERCNKCSHIHRNPNGCQWRYANSRICNCHNLPPSKDVSHSKDTMKVTIERSKRPIGEDSKNGTG